MKNIILFVLFVLLFIPGNFLFSQTENMFTAKDGWDNTKDSYSGYELVTIITEGGSDSSAVLDLKTGKADSWMYVYRDIVNKDKGIVIYVIKEDDMYFPILISDDEETDTRNKKLDDVQWMDSDEFFTALNNNQDYLNYLNNNDIVSSIVYLEYVFDSEGGTIPPEFIGKYDWYLELNLDFACLGNALTGEVKCEKTATDVNDENIPQNIMIFPQPAASYFNIILPRGLSLNSVEIYNIYGQKIYENNNNVKLNLLKIGTNDIPSGNYFLKINTNTGIITKKISIMK